jgi:pyrroline-5-carboxylate reductase
MKMAFIGGGAMGEAMVKCLLSKQVVTPQDVLVSDISAVRRELLSREYGVSTLDNNRKAVANADLIILAVKPQNLPQVMEEIGTLSPEQLVLSIVAGATLSSLCHGLNHSSVIRAMPNMPAQIGEGMTIWTATAEIEKSQKELAQTVLRALGGALLQLEKGRFRSLLLKTVAAAYKKAKRL